MKDVKVTESELDIGKERDVSKSTSIEGKDCTKAPVGTQKKDVLVHETEISVASIPV